jgi:HPt (histidine-containing phosphotransfer) domain-containing protein
MPLHGLAGPAPAAPWQPPCSSGVVMTYAKTIPKTTTPAWSPEPMLERLGGDVDLGRQLVTLFLSEYPRLVENLRASLASGRPQDVRRAAHAVKGSIANFIETGPHETAFEIERLGQEERLEPAMALVPRLERELAAIVPCMRTFERGGSCGS